MAREVMVVSAVRTAIGDYGGALKDIPPTALGATVEGVSDLAVEGLKVSGSAQQRKRRHLLHHGTLLCGFDLARITRYLHAPQRRYPPASRPAPPARQQTAPMTPPRPDPSDRPSNPTRDSSTGPAAPPSAGAGQLSLFG